MPNSQSNEDEDDPQYSPRSHAVDIDDKGGHPNPTDPTTAMGGNTGHYVPGDIIEPTEHEADARTRLLESYHRGAVCGSKKCDHGTFSPQPRPQRSTASSISSLNGFGGTFPGGVNNGGSSSNTQGLFGTAAADGVLGVGRGSTMSTTKWLAMKHGVKNRRSMYVYFNFQQVLYHRRN